MKRGIVLIISILLLIVFAITAFYIIPQTKKQFYPREYSKYVEQYSKEYNVPEPLIYAVILTESSFDANAKSSVGAIGLMQIMPETFEWLSRHIDKPEISEKISNPEINIKYGTFYLSYLYERFENWETVIAAYNAGHGRVSGWLKDTRYSADGKTLKNIPLDETKNYVNKVVEAYNEYQKIYYNGDN